MLVLTWLPGLLINAIANALKQMAEQRAQAGRQPELLAAGATLPPCSLGLR